MPASQRLASANAADVTSKTTQPQNGSSAPSHTTLQAQPTPQNDLQGSHLSSSQKPAALRLSPWAAQIKKLALARVDDDVVLSYIDAAGTFNLTADQIISLTEAGVPRNLIAAMIQHDADILAGVRQVLPSIVPPDSEPPLIPPPPRASVASPHAVRPSAPASEQYAFSSYVPDWVLEPLDEVYTPPEMQELSPVRKPYPVQLTAPILVWHSY